MALVACGGGGGASSESAALAPPAQASAAGSAAAGAAVPITGTDARRLAEQAAFGPTPELVTRIQALGSAWIDEQIATPATGYSPLPAVSTNAAGVCNVAAGPTCFRDKYTAFPIQLQFFQNAVGGRDQLRQRVALAYSQIFVVSSASLMPAYALRNYQQMLLDNAFVNFRQILDDVTLSPAMGAYLNMVNNSKGNPATRVAPNENFARELMQLFSLGPSLLNPDGTPVLRNGQRVPVYSQATVEGLARALTGWTYPSPDGATSARDNNLVPFFNGPMVPVASRHDEGSKVLLDGATLPAGGTPQSDLKAALDKVFNHPNVGPFIGKQLIQFLVTSNPSPAYVARVTAVFNDDGRRTRGNMAAVVKAILMDPEARGAVNRQPGFGKLREPVVDVAAVLRALSARTDGEYPNYVAFLMGQPLFGAATVFSFYPPNYPLPKSMSLVAPQFGVLNTASASARLNFISATVYAPGGLVFPPDPTVPGAIGTTVDLAAYSRVAEQGADELLRRLNEDLLHGTMSAAETAAITSAVQAVPANDPQAALNRARAAAYLTLASARYQVTR